MGRAGLPVLDAHAMTLPRSDATQVRTADVTNAGK